MQVLLGNDLAGNRVYAYPVVSDTPCVEDTELLDQIIFPSCTVTRAMRRKAQAEEMADQGNDSKSTSTNEKVVTDVNPGKSKPTTTEGTCDTMEHKYMYQLVHIETCANKY